MSWYENGEKFQEDNGYFIGEEWYPRVTKIVDIKSKPALYRFYSAVGFANGEKIKEQSASEGTLVHEAVEDILIGKRPEIDESIKPAVQAFERFLEVNEVEGYPELIEKRAVNCDARYAGTVDALVKLNGRFGILDIKTSQAVYRDYNLQTAAYWHALKEEFPDLETRWILRIDQIATCLTCRATLRIKGGRKKISKPFPYSNGICAVDNHDWSDVKGVVELKEAPENSEISDFEAFLGAKRLWEWENEFLLRKIGYL